MSWGTGSLRWISFRAPPRAGGPILVRTVEVNIGPFTDPAHLLVEAA